PHDRAKLPFVQADADALPRPDRGCRGQRRLRPLPVCDRVTARQDREGVHESELLAALAQPLGPPLERAGDAFLELPAAARGEVGLARELRDPREGGERLLRVREPRRVAGGAPLESALQRGETLSN